MQTFIVSLAFGVMLTNHVYRVTTGIDTTEAINQCVQQTNLGYERCLEYKNHKHWR